MERIARPATPTRKLLKEADFIQKEKNGRGKMMKHNFMVEN